MRDRFPLAILAGGLATRLHPLTQTLPKSLIPIHGIPFIDYQLRLFRKAGIRCVVLCVGYLGEMIQAYVGNGRAFDLEVSYSFDGTKKTDPLLGTAGCLKKALPLLGEHFFVCYGDSYLDCDYAAIQRAYLASKKSALMTIYHNQNQFDVSNVLFSEGRLVAYSKIQMPEMQHIDYGLGLFHASLFDEVPESVFCDLSSVYQRALRQQSLAAYEVPQRFYEIGSRLGIAAFEEFVEAL